MTVGLAKVVDVKVLVAVLVACGCVEICVDTIVVGSVVVAVWTCVLTTNVCCVVVIVEAGIVLRIVVVAVVR